jgi:hypothetical protein
MRSRSSSPASAQYRTRTGSWPPCCSPTSSDRPSWPPGWGIPSGTRFSTSITGWSGSSCPGSGDGRSTPRGTGFRHVRRPRPGHPLRHHHPGRAARPGPIDPGGPAYGRGRALGDKVGGIAVHNGARVSAQAGRGEVLVSRTVVDLVAGSGITFEDRGEHQLKGVPGSWRLLLSRANPRRWPPARCGFLRGRSQTAAGRARCSMPAQRAATGETTRPLAERARDPGHARFRLGSVVADDRPDGQVRDTAVARPGSGGGW